MTLRFDGRSAVVTGGGAGLGRAYALLLAQRGAKVLVNDLGEIRKPDGSKTRTADAVVEEIKQQGGTAVANYDSVEDGESIISDAMKAFGRVDILVNNAGIIRDTSFAKMTARDWDMLMRVHLYGTFACSKAIWPYMLKQQYGRIINISSGSGLYGNFGQVNYSSAKLGLVGFTKALAAEGQNKNILVNAVAPLAWTSMTERILPSELGEAFQPKNVAPIVAFLAHESCKDNGQLYELGGGWVAKLRWQRTKGYLFDKDFTLENVRDHWPAIANFSDVDYPTSLTESIQRVATLLDGKASSAGVGPVDALEGNADIDSVVKGTRNLKSGPIIEFMMKHVANAGEGEKLVKKVAASYQFDILPKKGEQPISFSIDLKNSPGRIHMGKTEKCDAHFTMLDEDFAKLVMGKLNPQMAFLQGKMKIKGNMRAATKFTPDLFPKYSKS